MIYIYEVHRNDSPAVHDQTRGIVLVPNMFHCVLVEVSSSRIESIAPLVMRRLGTHLLSIEKGSVFPMAYRRTFVLGISLYVLWIFFKKCV